MENIKIPFDKQAKTPEELIKQLIKRGMIVDNNDFAEDILSKVNYYRLSGYWFKHQYKYIKEKIIKIIYNRQKEGKKIPSEEVIDNLQSMNIGLNKGIIQDIINSINDNKLVDLFNDKLDNFFDKITFENVVDIYKFDSKLRSLCFDALEKIEISISTAICNHMCQTKTAYWFLDKDNVNTKTYNKKKFDGTVEEITIFSYDKLIERFNKDIKENEKSLFIKNFYSKYSDTYPPYWILSQIITFGTLSKIYTVLSSLDQKAIAKKMNFTVKFLDKSLVFLCYIRNICAHYNRLWDKENSITPININFKATNINSIYNCVFHTENNNTNFFPTFYTIALFLKNLYPKSKWVTLVSDKIKEYQTKTNGLVSFDKMGFPNNWQELPLFKTMLENK